MRTLVVSIAAIFALGLVMGGLFAGSLAVEAEQASIAELPTVDCGEGREALFEPVTANGTTTLRVKCVSVAAARTCGREAGTRRSPNSRTSARRERGSPAR